MQQSARKPFPYVTGETSKRPGRHVRALRRIGHALDRFDELAMRCLKAIGRAYLDGFIAYGAGMHGSPYPIDEKTPAAAAADVSVWVDPFGDVAEAQSCDMIGGSGRPLQQEPGQTGGVERAGCRPLLVVAADVSGHTAVGRNADETRPNPWSLSPQPGCCMEPTSARDGLLLADPRG
jgi:hypothetical protein